MFFYILTLLTPRLYLAYLPLPDQADAKYLANRHREATKHDEKADKSASKLTLKRAQNKSRCMFLKKVFYSMYAFPVKYTNHSIRA